MKSSLRAGALMCAFFFAAAASLCGQGSLTPPPGPPAPTMKSLSRIDPGKALNPASFGTTGIEIAESGYYYLTGNVTTVLGTETAIVVNASFVTIDLRGFSMVAAGGTGTGTLDVAINVGSGQTDVTVRNGVIRGTWWAGFYAPGTNCSVERLRVIGTAAYGIRLGVESRVTDCQVDGLSAAGFITGAGILTGDHSLVKNCIVSLCDGNGIQTGSHSSMLDSIAYSNLLAGITTGDGSTISRCVSSVNSGRGLDLDDGDTVADSVAYDNGGTGILGVSGGNVTNSCSYSSGDRGFSFGSASLAGCVAASGTNAGFVLSKASSVSHCVAGSNGDDGFVTNNPGTGLLGTVVYEGCVAYANGLAVNNLNADGFETEHGKVMRCSAIDNRGYGVRARGSDSDMIDGNLIKLNNTGGIFFISSQTAPLIIRNLVGTGNITPAPDPAWDNVGPFGDAQSNLPFINF